MSNIDHPAAVHQPHLKRFETRISPNGSLLQHIAQPTFLTSDWIHVTQALNERRRFIQSPTKPADHHSGDDLASAYFFVVRENYSKRASLYIGRSAHMVLAIFLLYQSIKIKIGSQRFCQN